MNSQQTQLSSDHIQVLHVLSSGGFLRESGASKKWELHGPTGAFRRKVLGDTVAGLWDFLMDDGLRYRINRLGRQYLDAHRNRA